MRVGMALSGGGALGAAHVGVLEQTDLRVDMDIICGSSSGAIVGLLYADGGSESVMRFTAALERAGIAGTTVGLLARAPSVTFETIRQALADNVKARSFAQLPLRFSCVATDIASGETVVIDDGDPVEAAMASSAFPGVFKAQKVSGRILVDGGVTRNLPADIVRGQGADFVIGSSLYGNLTVMDSQINQRQPGRVQAVLRALDIMAKEMAAVQCRECDFCFQPPVETFKWYDFGRLAQIMELGRIYAKNEIDNLADTLRKAAVHSL